MTQRPPPVLFLSLSVSVSLSLSLSFTYHFARQTLPRSHETPMHKRMTFMFTTLSPHWLEREQQSPFCPFRLEQQSPGAKNGCGVYFLFFICLRPIGQRRSSCGLASRARASSCDLAEPVHLELQLNLPLEFRDRGSRLHRDLDLAPAPSWVPLSFSLPPLPSSILLLSFPRFPLL